MVMAPMSTVVVAVENIAVEPGDRTYLMAVAAMNTAADTVEAVAVVAVAQQVGTTVGSAVGSAVGMVEAAVSDPVAGKVAELSRTHEELYMPVRNRIE